MKGDKILGIVALVIGIDLLAGSLLADVIGIGNPSFGIQQVVGTIIGVIVTVAGIFLLRRAN
jgi:hypothetical protein